MFSATKQMKRMQGDGCWKAFLSERKLLNAILRVSSSKWKMFLFMKWNVICNAEDRFSCLELFLRAKNTNAVRAKNTMLCLVQLSKWRESKATDAEKVLSQWEKGAKCNFKSNSSNERCFFFMKWNVICNAEDRFSCVRAFLQSKSC